MGINSGADGDKLLWINVTGDDDVAGDEVTGCKVVACGDDVACGDIVTDCDDGNVVIGDNILILKRKTDGGDNVTGDNIRIEYNGNVLLVETIGVNIRIEYLFWRLLILMLLVTNAGNVEKDNTGNDDIYEAVWVTDAYLLLVEDGDTIGCICWIGSDGVNGQLYNNQSIITSNILYTSTKCRSNWKV